MPKMTFVLVGTLKNKTVSLGSQGFDFVDGEMEFEGSHEEIRSIAKFLKRNWQAVPKPIETTKQTDKPDTKPKVNRDGANRTR